MEQIKGLIYGQCIADATGLAGEFLQSWQVAENYTFGKLGPMVRIEDSHRSTWLKGDWTDDSDHLILVLRSLRDKNPEETFFKRLQDWYYRGFPELGDFAGCGIGNTIRQAVIYEEAVKSASNGSIMRCAVVGLLQNDWSVVKSLAKRICQSTHIHPKAIVACVYVTNLVWNICHGEKDIERLLQLAYDESVSEFQKQKHKEEFEEVIKVKMLDDFVMDPIHGRGYVYRPLMATIYCLRNHQKGFEVLINEIIFKGGDTDTNCAVAGAVLGVFFGYSQLPQKWIEELLHKDWLEKEIENIFGKESYSNSRV